ncbi:MAG: CPBP family glutamic-type intramembrane protease [Sphaerochaetaceae bacterium]|nr:CPBP family glutamic-type intramembrane protease [Sphaerochaetaceae bacterium]
MNKAYVKKPLVFALCMFPIAVVGSILVSVYAYENYNEQTRALMIQQLGSYRALLLMGAIQGGMYGLFASFFGWILSDKVGLMRPFKFEKEKTIKVCLITVACGILFALDAPVFGSIIPEVRASYTQGISPAGFFCSLLYGGIVEELFLRLFVMSLISWIIWKVFARNKAREDIPQWVFITANFIAAVLFAAGHIPATISLFGRLDFWILFRCFLVNGGLGLVFGRFYRKWGIQYAFIGHFGCHLVSKLLLVLLL